MQKKWSCLPKSLDKQINNRLIRRKYFYNQSKRHPNLCLVKHQWHNRILFSANKVCQLAEAHSLVNQLKPLCKRVYLDRHLLSQEQVSHPKCHYLHLLPWLAKIPQASLNHYLVQERWCRRTKTYSEMLLDHKSQHRWLQCPIICLVRLTAGKKITSKRIVCSRWALATKETKKSTERNFNFKWKFSHII